MESFINKPESFPMAKVSGHTKTQRKVPTMFEIGNLLHWALIFLVVALIAAFLGFGGVAGTAMAGAKLIFWVAIALAILAFIVNILRPRG